MAQVKVYARLIQGSEHVHSSKWQDAPGVLFAAHLEVNGHRIWTETPEAREWKAIGKENGWTDEHLKSQPEDGWPQAELGVGEGFMALTIKHADDETWKFLSALPDDEFGEGSNREEFYVLVTSFEYILQEPGEDDPWRAPGPTRPMNLAELEIPVT